MGGITFINLILYQVTSPWGGLTKIPSPKLEVQFWMIAKFLKKKALNQLLVIVSSFIDGAEL